MGKDNNLTAIYKILENKIMNSSEYLIHLNIKRN